MSHPFDVLSIPNRPGRLIFTPCPGTKDSSIDSALNTLQQAGADAVLTYFAEEVATALHQD